MAAEEEDEKIIEDTVVEILKATDLETTTEFDVRTTASHRLNIDLSASLHHKLLVRRVVESFLLSTANHKGQEQTNDKEVVVQVHHHHHHQQQQEEKKEIESSRSSNSGRVICKLSNTRIVAIQDFRGQSLVTIRDYYQKDGKQFPTSRGISLTAKQWSSFRNSVDAIEEAIAKIESRKRSEDVGKRIETDVSVAVNGSAPQGLVPNESKQIEADTLKSVALGNIPVEKKQIEVAMSDPVTAFAPQGHIPHSSRTTFAPQRLVPIETIRLNGRNYHCWMHLMDFFLKQLKIAYVLTERCPSISQSQDASNEEILQAKACAQKWVDDDYVCRRSILNSLSDHLFDQYSKKTCSARELWEELKLLYNDDFGTARSQVNKYMQFEIVDGMSILEQVEELHRILDSIIACGMWVDENFHVSVIISKLPPSWKEYRMKLMQEEFLPLNMLMHRLRIEEEYHNHKKENASKKVEVVQSKVENNKLGPRKQEMKFCYICHKKGHIAKHCWHRKVDDDSVKSNDKDNGDVPLPAVPEANMFEGNVE